MAMSFRVNDNDALFVTRYAGPEENYNESRLGRVRYQLTTPEHIMTNLTLENLADLSLWVAEEMKKPHVDDSEL